MRVQVLVTAAALALVAAGVAAQRGGGTGPGGVEGAVMGGERARALTPFEEFANRLRLDQKEQVPQVAEIFNAAAAEAAPVGREMLQLRQTLLNVELSNAADQRQPVLEAYTAAAAKMASIEAAAFEKVYALLEPNQQSRASEAFELMAGFFQSGPVPSGGR
jgi:hypothetical protein